MTAEDVEHRCNGHFQGEHWKYPFAISHVWYPTRQQVERVDQLLSTTITKQARSLRPEMDLDYSDYQRQFIGFRSRGKNYIFAVGKRSGVLELKDRPPTKFLFDLCGGGTWFWSAAYELEANKLVDTSFNADK
ncbi:hypothetical protein HPT27_08900 [Permianibacter sp. IMCC34836]|uniref:hypothetical protein n=1 Tax=Permianibacter fluminis TaxID=2738515 RepID=UPI0015574DE2|nr:hypothetical protein [Permianibacter fluminis]NQD37142.1 hypothetical protein [Permianibacter fluminis]